MKLRCTALGHEFDDTTIERHREERERGTVLTVREYRTCRRCGIEEEFYKNEGIISAVSDDRDADEDPDPADETPAGETTGDETERPTTTERSVPEGGAVDAVTGDDAVIITETETNGSIDPAGPTDDGSEVVSGGPPDREAIPTATDPTAAGSEPRYRCPECGFDVPAEPSPLHEGDICANCRDGFIEYRGAGRT